MYVLSYFSLVILRLSAHQNVFRRSLNYSVKQMNSRIVRYLAQLSVSKIILWSYLIWYLVMSSFYFDPSLYLWATASGVGGIVGVALMLSTGDMTWHRIRTRFWESFRLFFIPFCVSSFSELVNGHGFIFFFSPVLVQDLVGLGAIGLFTVLILRIKNQWQGSET